MLIIMNNNKYTLNPAYTLKNDVNRAIITDSLIVDEYPDAKQSFTSFINPFYAIILTYFDGKHSFDECIKQISLDLEVDGEKLYEVLILLIENNNDINLCFNEICSTFPHKTLVNGDDIYGKCYDYKDFVIPHNKLDMKTMRFNKPLNINFVVNLNCVTNCVYCYADKQKNSYIPLSLERIVSLIREAKELGVKNFDITGGELFLHNGWEVILKKLLENGFMPYISTKVPITNEIILRYKDLVMRQLQISLDSVNPQILSKNLMTHHDYFSKMEQTLLNLEKAGIAVIINTIITSVNSSESEIEETVSYLDKYSNISKIRFSTVGYSLYLSEQENKNISISAEKAQNINDKINYLRSTTKKELTIGGTNLKCESFRMDKSKFLNRAVCTGNISAFLILPDGKVSYCEELYWHPRFIMGDLKEQIIMEMWQSKQAKDTFCMGKNEMREISPCSSCDEYSQCHGFPGVCWKDIIGSYGPENWDYPDPRCQLAPEPINSYFTI